MLAQPTTQALTEHERLRLSIIERLLGCLDDADRLLGASRAAAEISLAVSHLGGEAPAPPQAVATSLPVHDR